MIIKDVINYLEDRFPLELASDFDNGKIGLVIGDETIELKRILMTLDLNLEVVQEAINHDTNLIIAHHPFLFNPIYKVLFSSKIGTILDLMFKHQISLYVMHTNLDVGVGGVNDVLASLLNIKNIQGEAAKDQFLRYGEIEEVSLKELAIHVKSKFDLTGVKVACDLGKRIKRIGIVGGSGAHEEDIKFAISKNLDCYITGEIKLNVGQYAIENNLSLIEVSHGVEKFVFTSLQKEMNQDLNLKNQILISKINTDPLEYI